MITALRSTSLALLLLAQSACGGSAGESKSAGDAAGSSSDGSSWGEGEQSGPAEPAGPDCSDGTCFACGEGICPSGAYCDQNAEGGAACAWLPECSGTPTCGCITGVLTGCTCNDADGGPTVSCN